MKLYGFPWWFIMIGLIGFAYSLVSAQDKKPAELPVPFTGVGYIEQVTRVDVYPTSGKVEVFKEWKRDKTGEKFKTKGVLTPWDANYSKYTDIKPKVAEKDLKKYIDNINKRVKDQAKGTDKIQYYFDKKLQAFTVSGSVANRNKQVDLFFDVNMEFIKTYRITFILSDVSDVIVSVPK